MGAALQDVARKRNKRIFQKKKFFSVCLTNSHPLSVFLCSVLSVKRFTDILKIGLGSTKTVITKWTRKYLFFFLASIS